MLVGEHQKLLKFGGGTTFWLNPSLKYNQSFIKHLPLILKHINFVSTEVFSFFSFRGDQWKDFELRRGDSTCKNFFYKKEDPLQFSATRKLSQQVNLSKYLYTNMAQLKKETDQKWHLSKLIIRYSHFLLLFSIS